LLNAGTATNEADASDENPTRQVDALNRVPSAGEAWRRYRLPPDGFAGVLPLPEFAKGEAGTASFGFSFFGFFASRLPRCSPLAMSGLRCW
jgi:hypothetical protein